MKKVIVALFITLLMVSCSEYQKALKSEDPGFKTKVAEDQFNAGKYKKALRLYEQVAPSYKGKPNAERLFYFYAKSYYNTKQYYLAGYQFESFVASYPRSEKREEASFLGAECFYRLSPVYSLDQTDTEKALTKLQKFIDTYPNSEYLPQANTYVKELSEKLEKKAYEIAKQYNNISDYKASIKAFDNFLLDFPGTSYREKALFYRFDSAYQLAINSVPYKKEERLLNAKASYNTFVKQNADSEFKAQADTMLATIEKELQQYSNNN